MIAAEVFLWGTRIGVVMQEDSGSIAKFNYDKEFLKNRIDRTKDNVYTINGKTGDKTAYASELVKQYFGKIVILGDNSIFFN